MPRAKARPPRNPAPGRSGIARRWKGPRPAPPPGTRSQRALHRRNRRRAPDARRRCRAMRPRAPPIRWRRSHRPRQRGICARVPAGNRPRRDGSRSHVPAPPRCGHAWRCCRQRARRRERTRSRARDRRRLRVNRGDRAARRRDQAAFRRTSSRQAHRRAQTASALPMIAAVPPRWAGSVPAAQPQPSWSTNALRADRAAWCFLSPSGRVTHHFPAGNHLEIAPNSGAIMRRHAKGRPVMAEIKKSIAYSPSWTFFEGKWHDGNVPIMGPRTHAAWLGSVVFDGARAFEGVAPDLDRHVARANQSAISFGLKPVVDTGTWLILANEGIARFAPNAELYVRPMYWARNGSGGGVLFDPETTDWCLCIYEAPMPKPVGNAITLSPFRRPTAECAPVEAKAACLYPNNSRELAEAASRGFQNALMLDMLGNVAEFGNSNVFMAKDGVVYTPVPNGTFLNGITRQRVISLLRADGVTVVEKTLRYADFLAADEIFSTGNLAKVAPVIRIDDRQLTPGPFYARTRKLYWDFAQAVKPRRDGDGLPTEMVWHGFSGC